jgi:DNA-binding HxlR family transcriptional regulator
MQRKSFDRMPCRSPAASSGVGEWWSILILRDALRGLTRFRPVPGTLRDRAEHAGAPAGGARRWPACSNVRRYSERPPRDEYVLTARGRDFRPVLLSLMAWGNRHFAPEGESVRPRRRAGPARSSIPSWSTRCDRRADHRGAPSCRARPCRAATRARRAAGQGRRAMTARWRCAPPVRPRADEPAHAHAAARADRIDPVAPGVGPMCWSC